MGDECNGLDSREMGSSFGESILEKGMLWGLHVVDMARISQILERTGEVVIELTFRNVIWEQS